MISVSGGSKQRNMMKKRITIQVSDTTRKKLHQIKLDRDLKSIDDAIKYLIGNTETVRTTAGGPSEKE